MGVASKPKPVKLTSNDICVGMSSRFAPPEWAIMWEVGEATGGGGRYADAVMMSLWPSRGLELHGVEIKVSRSDWRREAMDPRKAEAIGRYCDRWWVHTSPGIIQDLSEVPPAWGVREFDGAKWKTLREAEKRKDPDPVGRVFLAALLRRADGMMRGLMERGIRDARAAESEALEKARNSIRDEIAAGVDRRMQRLEAREKNLAAFEAAFGRKVPDYADQDGFARLGRLCGALDKAGIDGRWDGATQLALRLKKMGDTLATALEPFIVPEDETS
jgi:hypothetical protein